MKPSIPYWITQVFGQGIFEDKRFLFERIMPFVNSENSEENSCPSHLFKCLWWPFKNPMKSCDCWQIFSKILSGNRLQHWRNRLHSYFYSKFKCPTFKSSGNRLHMMCNRLHTYKIIFNHFKALVIDYIVLVIDYSFENFENNFENISRKLCGHW